MWEWSPSALQLLGGFVAGVSLPLLALGWALGRVRGAGA
jgi:hypothetical protein